MPPKYLLLINRLPPLGSPFKGSCRRSRLRGAWTLRIASPAVQGRWRLRSRRRRGVGGLRILPEERRPIPPLRPPFGGHLPLKGEARGLQQLSGASEAKPGCDKEAMGCAPVYREASNSGRAAQIPAAVGRLWSLRGFFWRKQKKSLRIRPQGLKVPTSRPPMRPSAPHTAPLCPPGR